METIAGALLYFLKRAQRIETDRLHVAIAGALLGIPTVLYPGNYDKNRSVYETSLTEFACLRFQDDRGVEGA